MSEAPAGAKKSRAQKNAAKRKRKRDAAAAAAATSTHDTDAAVAAILPTIPPIAAVITSSALSGNDVRGKSNGSSKKKRKLASSGGVAGEGPDPGRGETPRIHGKGVTASSEKPARIDHSRHAAAKGQRQARAGRAEHHSLPLGRERVGARVVEEQQRHIPTTPQGEASANGAGAGRNKRKGPAASSEEPSSASGPAGDGGNACDSLAGSSLKPHAALAVVVPKAEGGLGQAAAAERTKSSSASPGGQRSGGGGGGVDCRKQQNGAKKKKKKKKQKKQQPQEAEERQNSQPSPPSPPPPALLPPQLRKPGGDGTAGPPTKRQVDGVTPSITNTGRSGSGGSGDRNGDGASKEGARLLSRALESIRKKQREEIGKGRPLAIWDVAAYAGLVFGELAAAAAASTALSSASSSSGGYAEDGGAGDGEVVAGAVDAVADAAQKDHAGQVSMSQFETLVRKEVTGFSARLRAASLLRRALEDEQAGDLDAAEASCAACLAAWPGFASGHLKMAKILRARGLSQQRAIKDVEFHLRQALGAASKAGTGAQGEEIAQAAAEGLSLLLCQEGRDKEAAKVLKRQGFRYRLSADVLRYPLPESKSRLQMPTLARADDPQHSKRNKLETPPHVGAATAPGKSIECRGRGERKRLRNGGGGTGAPGGSVAETPGGGGASEFVAAFDGALPQGMLCHLQGAFGSRSRFWSEHGYNSETGTPGYFSYIHSLGKPPTSSIEQVIGHVRKLAERSFPDVKEAKFVEWWAHRRPHSSGHQMHFDSDNEGRGGVRNPIVSVVVYVTGDVGGPTLVTTQRLTSKRLADRGWIVHPRVNRVCMFDGGVLHGVIPGRGVPTAAAVPAPCAGSPVEEEEEEEEEEGSSKASGRVPKKSDIEAENGAGNDRGRTSDDGEQERAGMRVTWMVAFWRDIQARPRPPPPPPPPLENKPKKARVGKAPGAGVGVSDPAARRRLPPSGAGAAQPFPAMPPLASADEEGRAASARREGENAFPEGEKGGGKGGGGGGGGGGKGGEGCGHPASPSWPALFRKKPDGWGGGDTAGGDSGSATREPRVVIPVSIPQVWEDVDAVDNKRAGAGVRRLKRLPEYDLCFQGF
ncbi:unnamed protein product [Scytosiphon promiscuus]